MGSPPTDLNSGRRGRLTPGRRRVLDRVFDRLLTLEPAARRSELEQIQQRHPRLGTWLQALLAAATGAADQVDDMLSAVAATASGALETLEPELPAGTRLGAWRILERVGSGGMGCVYRAERADGAFDMEAAVKLIRLSGNTELQARLTLERQLLARLDHPNIARIVDGGTTDQGQTFIVMEWVPGEDLHQYQTHSGTPPKQCLKHLLRLAEAVNHAHQRGIVHGDIKPANVRIDQAGRVRLVDFGVARVIDEGGPDQRGFQALTRNWSAPELLRGDPPSTQSDIWSLGALLYWLLTGTEIPADPRHAAATLQAQLRHRCRNASDLVAIVSKACAIEPDDRYPGVSLLIEDMERYGAGRPVQARRQTSSYVALRFVGRNPIGVGMAVTAAVLLIAGLAGTSWQAREAALERDRARFEAERTERISEFLFGLFEQADPWQNTANLTVNELVTRGVASAEQLNDTPRLKSELLRVMARVHRGLADYQSADELSARALDLIENQPNAPREELAATWLMRARVLASLGRYSSSQRAAERALELVAEGPEALRAEAQNQLGIVLYSLGRFRMARGYLEQALAWREQAHPGSAELAESYNNLAVLLAAMDQREEALRYYERALNIRRRLLGERHPTTSFTMTNVATLRVQLGEIDAARALFREALAIRQDAFGQQHPAVASVYYQLGWAEANDGNLSAAADHYARALSVREAFFGPDHPSVAVILNAMANVDRRRGRLDDALDSLRRALAIYRQSYPEGHHDIALVLSNLGTTLLARGHNEQALDRLHEALSMNRSVFGNHHHHVADTLTALAQARLALGQTAPALERAREAEVILRELYPDEAHPDRRVNRELIARIDGRASAHGERD